jgi:hypothetical protein
MRNEVATGTHCLLLDRRKRASATKFHERSIEEARMVSRTDQEDGTTDGIADDPNFPVCPLMSQPKTTFTWLGSAKW